ncbi:MAG TPA: c-type cytochrome [Burkholderiales bacterium]
MSALASAVAATLERLAARACVALALAGMLGGAFADEPASGREVYELRCRTCHGGTAAADSPLGPSLAGIIGTTAGTQRSGLHSRALMDSGIVWDRASLRRFLSDPPHAIPGTLMPTRVVDAAQLEPLLDYLESLH